MRLSLSRWCTKFILKNSNTKIPWTWFNGQSFIWLPDKFIQQIETPKYEKIELEFTIFLKVSVCKNEYLNDIATVKE